MEMSGLPSRISSGRRLAVGFALCLLACLALAPAAGATLAYVTGGFPTTPPKLPQPEWVWAARDDGSAAHRLALGSAPHVSPDGKLIAYASARGLAVIPAAGGAARVLIGSDWQDEPTLAWSPDSKTLVAVIGPVKSGSSTSFGSTSPRAGSCARWPAAMTSSASPSPRTARGSSIRARPPSR